MEWLWGLLVNMHWGAVGQIIMIDILLGGDNAVVIALACRNLPHEQRNKGVFWGTFGAIALRVVLITFAVMLLDLPFLKLVGAALLLWIGIKLLVPEDEHGAEKIQGSSKLLGAIKTIIVADFVMSLDNVIAIAGAAQQAHDDHQTLLVIFGLLVSVPFIVFGSQIILKLLDRFPVIVWIGGGLLGTAAYASSKAGVNGLTKAVAKEGGKFGVRCNAVCPSLTLTDMTSILSDENSQRIINGIPLGRAAQASEPAQMVLFFASDLASFVNGEIGDCDGGIVLDG